MARLVDASTQTEAGSRHPHLRVSSPNAKVTRELRHAQRTKRIQKRMSKVLAQQKINQFARARKLRPEYVEYMAAQPTVRKGAVSKPRGKDKSDGKGASEPADDSVLLISPHTVNEPDIDLTCYETLDFSGEVSFVTCKTPRAHKEVDSVLAIKLFNGKSFGIVRFQPIPGLRPRVFASTVRNPHVPTRRVACMGQQPAVGTPERQKRKYTSRSPKTYRKGAAVKPGRKRKETSCSASLERLMHEAAAVVHPPLMSEAFELGDVPCASVDNHTPMNIPPELVFLITEEEEGLGAGDTDASMPLSHDVPILFDANGAGPFDGYSL
jgi:hypothetical protein